MRNTANDAVRSESIAISGTALKGHGMRSAHQWGLGIAAVLVLGSVAFVPGLYHLASTLLQIVFLYFKTGMRG